MADTPTENTEAAPAAKAKRTQGDIDKRILADIKLAEDIAEAAADPDHAPALANEDVNAAAVASLAQMAATARDLGSQIVATKKQHLAATKTETKAGQTLLAAVRDIQTRAKRKFPKDKTRQAAYAIGKKNLGKNRTEFEQDADNILKLAGTDALPGLKPEKLTAATTALATWKQADADQTKTAETQAKLLADLQTKATEMNDSRRDIQRAADTAWPPGDPANAATRRAFKIPANKPMAM